jgi:hypothetical protein
MIDINNFDVNTMTLGAVAKNSRNGNYCEVKVNGRDAIEAKLRFGGSEGLVAPFACQAGEFADEAGEKISMALNVDGDHEAFAKKVDDKVVGLMLPRSKELFGKNKNELELRDKQTVLFREGKDGYPPKINLKVRVAQKKDKGKLVGRLTRIDFATLDPGARAYGYVPGTADQIPKHSRIIAECRLGAIWTNATKNWGITLEAMHIVVFPPPPGRGEIWSPPVAAGRRDRRRDRRHGRRRGIQRVVDAG